MADFIDHLHQAQHNMDCAKRLVSNPQDRDWAITAAFYSAVHFAEAGFNNNEILHSESKCPSTISPHKFRENMVKAKFGNICFRSYRKLFDASYNVRYLPMTYSTTGIALDYYSQADAIKFIDTELATIIKEIQNVIQIPLN